MHLEFK